MLFWLIVITMSGLAAMFIIVPLLRGQGGTVTDREGMNIAIFKDRLQEMEQALEDELVEQEEFDALKRDLEVSLLGSVKEEGQALTSGASIPKSAVPAVALFIPILAIGLYQFSLGAIEDVQLAEALKVVQAESDHGEKMSAFVKQLHARMQEQPDNFDGWFLLGQTQLGLRDYEGAARSFDYLSDRFPRDAAGGRGANRWAALARTGPDARSRPGPPAGLLPGRPGDPLHVQPQRQPGSVDA